MVRVLEQEKILVPWTNDSSLMNELSKYSNGANNGNSTNGLVSKNTAIIRSIPELERRNAPDRPITTNQKFGWNGVIRTIQIIYFLGGFLLYVWMDFRGWL